MIQTIAGSIPYLLQKIEIENVIICNQFEISANYKEFADIVKKTNTKVHIVEKGQRINIENDLYIDVLWPNTKEEISKNSINNNSLVCKMVYKEISILFTGDIEEIAEKAILKEYKDTNTLKSTILKVAHHGSKSSSIQEFLDVISPKIALIGVGKNNNFGHPNKDVISRLKNMHIKIYRTDENGEITIQVNKKGNIWINKMLN